jgi:hypothetical protein
MALVRTPSQLRQLQFHWGKPPPAALPSTLMRMVADLFFRLEPLR